MKALAGFFVAVLMAGPVVTADRPQVIVEQELQDTIQYINDNCTPYIGRKIQPGTIEDPAERQRAMICAGKMANKQSLETELQKIIK